MPYISEFCDAGKKKSIDCGRKKQDSLYKELFPAASYMPCVFADNLVEVKQRLGKDRFDLVWIQKAIAPLLVRELSALYNIYMILFVKAAVYDQVMYQMRDSKVFVFTVPVSRSTMTQVISMVDRFLDQTIYLEKKLVKAHKKLSDIKTIDRCKMELMHYFHWSEPKAHRYIEKTAMDSGMTKIQVASHLLTKLELKKAKI